MKKIFKVVKNIFIVLALIVYFSIIIGVSTLVLSRNDYNVSQFGDKVLILMDDASATNKYKANSLVILKTIDIRDIESGQEIFVYEVNEEKKSVSVIIEKVGKVVIEGTSSSPYIVLDNIGKSYGEDYIAGVAYTSYDDIGKYLSIIESKWVFFALLIVPCFFILIYEIYLLIVSIKYEDFGDTVNVPNEKKVSTKQKVTSSKENNVSDDMSKQLEDIQDEIFNMKEEAIKEENTQDENQKKIEELMNQVNKLKEEVASKNN